MLCSIEPLVLLPQLAAQTQRRQGHLPPPHPAALHSQQTASVLPPVCGVLVDGDLRPGLPEAAKVLEVQLAVDEPVGSGSNKVSNRVSRCQFPCSLDHQLLPGRASTVAHASEAAHHLPVHDGHRGSRELRYECLEGHSNIQQSHPDAAGGGASLAAGAAQGRQ